MHGRFGHHPIAGTEGNRIFPRRDGALRDLEWCLMPLRQAVPFLAILPLHMWLSVDFPSASPATAGGWIWTSPFRDRGSRAVLCCVVLAGSAGRLVRENRRPDRRFASSIIFFFFCRLLAVNDHGCACQSQSQPTWIRAHPLTSALAIRGVGSSCFFAFGIPPRPRSQWILLADLRLARR